MQRGIIVFSSSSSPPHPKHPIAIRMSKNKRSLLVVYPPILDGESPYPSCIGYVAFRRMILGPYGIRMMKTLPIYRIATSTNTRFNNYELDDLAKRLFDIGN